jgi:cyclopropane-fatty-acyl-phospholipid synthase
MEHMPRYEHVLDNLKKLVRPGGRAYFDFSAGHVSDDTSSFVTKYIWPGRFRSVFMPDLFDAISKSPFEVVELWNDRHNYYIWALKCHDKWVARKDEVVRLAGEELWRMWRLLFAGVADVMSPHRQACTAYRIVLERRP